MLVFEIETAVQTILDIQISRRSLLQAFAVAPLVLDQLQTPTPVPPLAERLPTLTPVALRAEMLADGAIPTPETHGPGIFQTGVLSLRKPNTDIALDSIYNVQLRPAVVRELTLALTLQRNKPELLAKVADFLDQNPIEINLSDDEILGKTIGDGSILGSFTGPIINDQVKWPTIELSGYAVRRIFEADQAIRRPDLLNEDTFRRYLDTNTLIHLPHELEHLINYIDNPGAVLAAARDYGRKKALIATLSAFGSALITGSLGWRLIGRKTSNPRDTFISALIPGVLGGRLGDYISWKIMGDFFRFDSHNDTPEVYSSISQRLSQNMELLVDTAATFDFQFKEVG